MPSESSDGVVAELLNYLRSNPGRILSREELAAEVWHAKFFSGSRSIDMAVCLARKRLDRGERIICVRAAGYIYEPIASVRRSKRGPVVAGARSNGSRPFAHSSRKLAAPR